MAIENGLRIGIIAHRFECPGGIQTIFLELIEGSTTPASYPTSFGMSRRTGARWAILTSGPRSAAASSASVLRLSAGSPRLAGRLRPWSVRHARLRPSGSTTRVLFEPGVKMPKGVPNLCWIAGPRYLRLPGDRVDQRRFWKPGEIKMTVNHLVQPLARPTSILPM